MAIMNFTQWLKEQKAGSVKEDRSYWQDILCHIGACDCRSIDQTEHTLAAHRGAEWVEYERSEYLMFGAWKNG